MDASIEHMRRKEQWNGKYKGISFEIQHYDFEGESFEARKYSSPTGSWTFYLLLVLDQFSPEIHDQLWLEPEITKFSEHSREHISYNYDDSWVINGIDWHCGCTWYSKLGGLEIGAPKDRRIIKVGCDYQHYWDEGHYYSVENVLTEVKQAIDSLYELVDGKIKHHCTWCGRYYHTGMVHPRNYCSPCVAREYHEAK